MTSASVKPLISIIVPTYNRASLIEEALNSVFNQTYEHFELIVVDDGSTDDTAEKLKKFQADQRFTLVRQENQGQAAARNRGLEIAAGEYFCFLDSDNFWPNFKLEEQVSIALNSPEFDVIYGDIIVVDGSGTEISRRNMPRKSGRITEWLLRDNSISMNTVMFKRRCYEEMGGMKVSHRAAEDYELWLRYSTRFTFKYVERFWVYYRVFHERVSSDAARTLQVNEEILETFRKDFPSSLSAKQFDSGMSFFYLRKARYMASVGERKKAFGELRKALKKCPTNPLVYRTLAAIFLKRSW